MGLGNLAIFSCLTRTVVVEGGLKDVDEDDPNLGLHHPPRSGQDLVMASLDLRVL